MQEYFQPKLNGQKNKNIRPGPEKTTFLLKKSVVLLLPGILDNTIMYIGFFYGTKTPFLTEVNYTPKLSCSAR